MQIKDLIVGTNVDLSLVDEKGKDISPYFATKIQNINSDGTIEVDIPIIGMSDVKFEIGSLVRISMVFNDAIYSFQGRILGRSRRRKVPILIIKPESDINRIQRRAYYRLKCYCCVQYRPYKLPIFGENQYPFKVAKTVNISGGGMCLLIDEKIEKTGFLECVIMLEKDMAIKVIGKVIDVKESEFFSRKWEARIKFEKISEKDREKIINYIFREQLKLRRKGLM